MEAFTAVISAAGFLLSALNYRQLRNLTRNTRTETVTEPEGNPAPVAVPPVVCDPKWVERVPPDAGKAPLERPYGFSHGR